jgi:hypothetical protein
MTCKEGNSPFIRALPSLLGDVFNVFEKETERKKKVEVELK